MSWIKRMARDRRSDERGVTLVFTAICMVGLLWAGAMGVDLGFSVWGSRTAQAMADTAALDMGRYIGLADQITTLDGGDPALQAYLNGKLANVLTENGSNASLTVTPGLWSESNGVWSWSVPSAGCSPTVPPSGPACNAVKVSAIQAVPQIFFGGFNALTGHASNSSAYTIVSDTPESSFSVGSYLANFSTQQSDVMNDILGSIDTNPGSLNISLAGYEGLANTYVTLNQLITASGTLLNSSDVMTTSLSASQWLGIWEDAVDNQEASLNCGASPTPSACTAYSTMTGDLSFANSDSIDLCSMFTINGTSCGTVSTADLNASLDVLQALTTEAEVTNGNSGINVTSALNLTDAPLNFGTVDLYLDVIQPAQVAYGPVGTVAETAQVSSDLTMNLSDGGLPLGTLSIPLSAASATSTLNTITCSSNAMTSTKINTTTAAASGTVTLSGVGNVATLNVSGVNNGATSYSASVVPPTATTQTNNTNPKSVGSTSPTLNYSGVAGGLNSLISPLLASTSVVSEAYGSALQGAGVSLAGAEIADLSTNCDAVSIVQ